MRDLVDIFKFAWRNLWRNTRRTAITLAAVSLNTAILIMSFALMEGLFVHMVSNATNLVKGEAQIHTAGYLTDRSLYKTLDAPGHILDALDEKRVPAAARSYGFGLVAHETKSAGALIWGVDPARERVTFDLFKHMALGEFLSGGANRGVVLGKKLARSLNVTVGDEVVVVAQAADGSLGNDLYRVTGILKNVDDSTDRNAAIFHRDDFAELFVSGGRVHEIAINTKGRLDLAQVAALAEEAAPKEDVKTWRQLIPALSELLNLFDVSIALFGSIFFIAGGLGVMNTMLMATFERMREFGILKAIGTTPWRIMRDVTAEAFVLGLLATAMGVVMGLASSYYLMEHGLDLSVFTESHYSIAGVAFDPVWRAALSLKSVVVPVVGMWLICLIAAVYPAALAARLDPVKVIHHV